ncbi:MAG: hypothetical protein R2697_11590 [Ilumatobacteraceae bacterium]
MLFLVAAVAISIATGAWWLQRVAFTPDATRDSAAAILEEADIRVELNTVISGAAAPYIETNPTDLGTLLEDVVMTSRPGAAVMAPVLERIHDRIIGNLDDPVVVTGADMVPIVRDERAHDAPDVTLPIGTIGVLANMRRTLGWLALGTGVIGVVALVLGILTRPDRRDVLRGLGEFGIALAASMIVFGYLVPVHLLTALDNQTWTHAIPRLAMRTTPVVFGAAVIFAVVGVVLILSSMSGGKRRQWSTPLSVARYRGGDNPGWG